MAADLLPCPFCGASAHVVVIEFADGGPINYGECSNAACCIAFPSADTEDEAIARWNNRRAPPLAAPAPTLGQEHSAFGDWCATCSGPILPDDKPPCSFMCGECFRKAWAEKDARHAARATPPAAPAAVTIPRDLIDEARALLTHSTGGERTFAFLERVAALSAAASAERGK